MIHTIELPPWVEERAARQAQQNNMALNEYLADQIRAAVTTLDVPRKTEATTSDRQGAADAPDERAERVTRFLKWAGSQDRNTPLLSDEAISREAIYGDAAGDAA